MEFNTHINFNITDIENILDYSQYSCDFCREPLTENHYYIGDYKIQLCEKCIDNFFNLFTHIDRTNFTEQEKPRRWNCESCRTALGGGLDWYCIESKDFDLCKDCYGSKKTKYTKNLSFINRGWDPVPVDLSLPNITNFYVPDEIKNEITEERNKLFINSISDIAKTDIKSPLLYWTLFTNISDMYLIHESYSALIVNCNKDSNNEVGVIIFDDHGRVSLNTIFKSFDQYLIEYNKWKNSQIEESTRVKIKCELEDTYNSDELEDMATAFTEKLMKVASTFSEYIVLQRGLETYYG